MVDEEVPFFFLVLKKYDKSLRIIITMCAGQFDMKPHTLIYNLFTFPKSLFIIINKDVLFYKNEISIFSKMGSYLTNKCISLKLRTCLGYR